jgi:hypothetical protein
MSFIALSRHASGIAAWNSARIGGFETGDARSLLAAVVNFQNGIKRLRGKSGGRWRELFSDPI